MLEISGKCLNLNVLKIKTPDWSNVIVKVQNLDGLQDLGNLKNLKSLYLRNINVLGGDWDSISCLSNLTDLTLLKCNISDISCLDNMMNLESLILTDSSVTNGLYALHDKVKLKKLYLDGTAVGDISLYKETIYKTIDILLGLRPSSGALVEWKLSSIISADEKARMK